MNDFKVIKKDGTSEGWDWNKIKVAIDKAKKRANVEVPEWRFWQIEGYIEGYLWRKTEITTEELHKLVIDTLNQYAPEVVSLIRNTVTIRTPMLKPLSQ